MAAVEDSSWGSSISSPNSFSLYKAHHIIWNPSSVFHTILLAAMFISLGCSRTFLIKFSMRDGGYDYLPVTVNVLAEFLKFIVCFSTSMYLTFKEGKTAKEIFSFANVRWSKLFKWSLPGLLYFFDNLLGFYILVHLSPAVYSLMGNFVIITTAVLFRVVLKRKLSRIQWASLLVLFLSIVALSNQNPDTSHLKHHHRVVHDKPSRKDDNEPTICRRVLVPQNFTSVAEVDSSYFRMKEGHLLVLLQCVLSSSANIYNEKIFKEGSGMEESIYLQNSKLYMFGIFFNVVPLVLRSDFRVHVWHCGFFHGHNIQSTILIMVTAAYGLTVALILKFRDNMFQVMTFQLTNVLVITASVLFMGFHPELDFFLIAPIVLLAIFIFNAGKKKTCPQQVTEQEYSPVAKDESYDS